ncbi:MAG: ubiquinol-cytochrome c reductase iron-sulfur subunit [Planctomycetes bacterium]|nr:ubiquinol-cytochrome c reductase iron-sulfur subunit [Planctomycetota bacterium]
MASTTPPTRTANAQLTRRSFLESVSTGWFIFTAACIAGLSATARFFFPNDLFEPPTRFKIGLPENYAPNSVDENWKAKYRIWVVRDGEKIVILNATCTHLGCTPNWLLTEGKFKCPCHGSGFYRDGINFEGPAPRPLERFKLSLAADGQIEVDKSRKYQKELGQWNDPDSFLKIS